MDNSPDEDDLLDEDSSEFFINFPPDVQKAIDEVVESQNSFELYNS